ncbi:alpha/beta fold hydrolase [Streptosporangium sp. NPDC005286]|uniref:alpha/beta hydrolase family protein n=1 Tax=Streptosporangium sp. NPDC005286 TaxID=3154463 RepID=UPI0033BFAC5B
MTGTEHLRDGLRINFRLSGHGRYAACVAAHGRDRHALEIWDLTGDAPRPRLLRTRDGLTPMTVPIPTDDGHVLLCRLDDGDGAHHLLLAVPAPDGEETEEHQLAVVRGRGIGLIAGLSEGTAAVAFVIDADRHTTVWRLSGLAEAPEPIAELPGLVNGGIWLDEAGTRLAVPSAEAGASTRVLDLSRGALVPLVGAADDEHVLRAAPRAGVLLVAARRGGAYRLGVRHRDDASPTVFPDRLNAIEGTVTPLALDLAGRRLALSVTRGARSHLLLHDLVEDTTGEIDLPPGKLYPAAQWTTAGLHLVYGAPDRPSGLVTVSDLSPARVLFASECLPTPWTPARVQGYDGPTGRVEAIVYGDPVTSPRVVLALHGGPEAAWHLGFEPMFQHLAAAGIAVVAPNQRGSTGYGAAHRDAIQGAWGGPDLADIVHLGDVLAAARHPGMDRPMLYGASYGAYLALLAAAARPDLWARAAVVAPFLSGRELYEDGPPPVQTMLDRLGGREEPHDELGPRDLLRLADRIRLPLLVVHGERDPIIPVAHSRRLCDRLLQTGHHHGAELTYLEIPGAGHDPLSESGGHVVRDRLIGFLRA